MSPTLLNEAVRRQADDLFHATCRYEGRCDGLGDRVPWVRSEATHILECVACGAVAIESPCGWRHP